jgi:hypothetical protein
VYLYTTRNGTCDFYYQPGLERRYLIVRLTNNTDSLSARSEFGGEIVSILVRCRLSGEKSPWTVPGHDTDRSQSKLIIERVVDIAVCAL